MKLIHGVSTTCTAMSGSGVMIGMVVMVAMRQTHKDQLRAGAVSCAAAAGSTTRGTVALRAATGSSPAAATATAASASAATGCRRNEGFAIIPAT